MATGMATAAISLSRAAVRWSIVAAGWANEASAQVTAPFPGQEAPPRQEQMPPGTQSPDGSPAGTHRPGTRPGQQEPQARAEEPPRERAWKITPDLKLGMTYSDNLTLAPAAAALSGWVTDITPGIRVEGRSARLRGYFDYRLHNVYYANRPGLDNRQNLLSSLLTLEAVEKRFFIDARASISQLNRSAFGATPTDVTSAMPNRVETSVYQVSPYVRGRISDIALYQVRFNATYGSTSGASSGNSTSSQWVASVRNASPSVKLGWQLEGSTLSAQSSATGTSETARARAGLIYQARPELHFTVFEGIETINVPGSARRSAQTPGAGVAWNPGPRTQVAVIREKRFFGTAQNLQISHRTPLMAFRYSEDKDAVVLPLVIAAAGPGSLHALMSDLQASSIPDPIQRAQAVNVQLARAGLQAETSAVGGFDSSRMLLRHNRQASAVMVGRRNTLTLTWTRVNLQALGTLSGAADSFSLSPSIRQEGLSFAWASRLSALSSLTVQASRLHSAGATAGGPDSTQSRQSVQLSHQLGPRTAVSLGARQSQFDSTVANGYREKAILAALSMRF